MASYTRYDLVAFREPLEPREAELPEPKGREVLLRTLGAGVCHSDLHMIEGEFDLGEEGVMRMVDRGMRLPKVLGHEIVGEVVAKGPDATAGLSGRQLVFPWLGCGTCRACGEARTNDCAAMRIVGLVMDGGYATHILAEDEDMLVDIGELAPAEAAPLACSGLTVYNALGRLGAPERHSWLAVLGVGGLGLNAIAIGQALGFARIVAVDVGEAKLEAASGMGATATLDARREDALEALREICGGQLTAVLDTVGAAATARLGVHALIKGGHYVVVGLHGGDFKMPQPWLAQKAMIVQGCHVGTVRQLRELVALVRAGKVRQMPIETRPLSQVNGALDDLRAGRVTGRVVLTPDA